jgi:hypothetical protein
MSEFLLVRTYSKGVGIYFVGRVGIFYRNLSWFITYGSVCRANFECATGSSDICSVGDPAQLTFNDCFTDWDCEALYQNEIRSWNSNGSVPLMYSKPGKAGEELYLDKEGFREAFRGFYEFGWIMIGVGLLTYCICTGCTLKCFL